MMAAAAIGENIPAGTEISVNHYDFITLYLACRVPKGTEVKERIKTANLVDELCRNYAAERFMFDPKIGELVGVYLPDIGPSGQWVRGRVEACIWRSSGHEYKILLIDQGQYVKSMRRHLVQLNEVINEHPPLSKRLGLHGVLPEVSLNQNTRLFITDFFHRGSVYFKKTQKIGSILFGDISVQQHNDGKVISLTAYLLANKLVKKVDDFEQEATRFYGSVEGMDVNQEACCNAPATQPQGNEETNSSQSPTKNQELPEVERTKHAKDTGYSSSDDYTDEPFVKANTVFVPVGFHYDDKLQRQSKQKEVVKPIKNHFQLLREREKQKGKRVKSSTKSKEVSKQINQDEPKSGIGEIRIENQPLKPEQVMQVEEEEEVQTVFQPRNVKFGEMKPRVSKDGSSSERDKKARARAFDFDYKSKLESPEKAIPEKVEGKLDVTSSDCLTTKETNELSKEEIGDLESSQTSRTSSGINNVNLSIEAVKSSVPNNNTISSDDVIPTVISKPLSKKQRLSQKLKAGLAIQEIVKDLTGVKGEKECVEEQCPNNDVCKASKSRSTEEDAFHNNEQLPNTNHESRKRSSKFVHLEMSSSIGAEAVPNKEDKLDQLNLNQVSKRTNIDNVSIDSIEYLKENGTPNTSLKPDVAKNNLQDKKKRIRERLRKSREFELATESDSSQKDPSHSSCQSVCSEESHHVSSTVTEKPTLKSFVTEPIDELENPSEDFDYVETTECKTFISCINETCGVLIHTKNNCIVRPAFTLLDCHLDRNIIQTLEHDGKREMNRIQKFAFPTILARHNIAMISPRRSGKTCGYVVPISSNLLSDKFYLKLPSGNGPRALVVTPCWESGAIAAAEFRRMSPCNCVIHCYGGGAELELKLELLGGCDVLVTTPRCILRLLDYELTNLIRLCHFVMDDADVLFNKFKPEMQKLMVAVDSAEQERERLGVEMQLQVVLAARKWSAPIEELVTRILFDPTICIASQLEACVYAGIKPTVVCVPNEKKIEKLVDVLKEVEGKQRTIIMCHSKDDAKYLYNVLLDLGVKNVIAAHEDLSSIARSEIPGLWHKNRCISEKIWNESTSMPIMIRSDEVLEDIPITNASVLIHYNMSNSKKTFGLRFISLMENFHNVLKKETSIQKPQVFILIDEKNDLEFPGIMEFMERLGTVLPDPVLKTLEKIEKMNDQKRISEPLCDDMKEFGECWDVKSCPARHIVDADLDFPRNVPRTGWVKILVECVHSACHYSARLIAHAEKENEWKNLPRRQGLSIELDNYYAQESNKRLHGRPAIGDMVALERRGIFQRAVILKILKYDKYDEPVTVYLRLVDNGGYYEALVSRLWYLPEELATPPPAVVDIYLCGLKPKDLDVSWPPAPGLWVEKQFKDLRRNYPDGYMLGKINLALNGNLWLEPLEYFEFLPSNDITIFLFDVRKNLLQTTNALENNKHIPTLRSLSEKAGLDLPLQEKVQIRKLVQPKPQWAWLPQDRNENVHVVVVQDTDAVFLRINNFIENLQRLAAEIEEYASTRIEDDNDSKKLMELGSVCLGKQPGTDEWNRAIIKSKPAEDLVELFFVDYGDMDVVTWDQVLPISNKHITKLPFQVIECYFAGIQFLPQNSENKKWEDSVIDMIYDLTRDDNEGALHLMVKVCSVESKATYTGGRRYKVVLADCNADPIVTINSKLASSPFAEMCVVEEDKLLEGFDNPDTTNDNSNRSKCGGNISSPTNLEVALRAQSPSSTNLEVALPAQSQSSTNLEVALPDQSPSSTNLEVALPAQSPSSTNLEVALPAQSPSSTNLEVALPAQCSVDDEGEAAEKNRKLTQLMREFEDDKFEYCSPNLYFENDADVSENGSEDSVLSLPRPTGSLPRTTISQLQLPPPETEDSSSASSKTISSSHYSSTLSLNQMTNNSENCEENKLNADIDTPSSCEPLTRSITPFSCGQRASFSPDASSPLRISWKANNFKDFISPNLISSPPFFKRVSPPVAVSDNDDSELDNTISEINADSDIDTSNENVDYHPAAESESHFKINFSHTEVGSHPSRICPTEEVKPGKQEIPDKKISPCQKWVESVLPDSDEDISFTVQDLVEEGREVKHTDCETRTPLVEWHQDDNFVFLHIKLPAITDFEFTSDITSVHFSTVYGGVAYQVDLPELYGGHKQEKAQAVAKACYFQVQLEKLLKGKKKNWPRLTKRDEKFHWLKLNAEKACEGVADSEDDEDVKRLACTLPLWNENPTDSISIASSERTELAGSELSL